MAEPLAGRTPPSPAPPPPAAGRWAALELVRPASRLPRATAYDQAVAVCNLEDRPWRAGPDGAPPVRLAHRWVRRHDDGSQAATPTQRSALDAPVEPGSRIVTQMRVLTPETDGHYVLEVDVVDERARSFGRPARQPVTIGAPPTGAEAEARPA